MDRPLTRAFDLIVGGVGSLLTAPIVLTLIVLIRLESPGAPVYTQIRVGRDGVPFRIYKLRTMVSGAEFQGAGLAIAQGDSRITRIGALLRRTSLDELPNLWNVVRGEMSIIGPRPTLQHQVDAYTERQRGRLAVKPGITGWAQVNGRASLPWPERIELDLWYVEHRSLRLDLEILRRTAAQVRGGGGIYKGERVAGNLQTGSDPEFPPSASSGFRRGSICQHAPRPREAGGRGGAEAVAPDVSLGRIPSLDGETHVQTNPRDGRLIAACALAAPAVASADTTPSPAATTQRNSVRRRGEHARQPPPTTSTSPLTSTRAVRTPAAEAQAVSSWLSSTGFAPASLSTMGRRRCRSSTRRSRSTRAR